MARKIDWTKKVVNKTVKSKIVGFDMSTKGDRRILRVDYEIDPSVATLDDGTPIRTSGYFDEGNFYLYKVMIKWWQAFGFDGELPRIGDIFDCPKKWNLIGHEGFVHYVLRTYNDDPDGVFHIIPERFLLKRTDRVSRPRHARNIGDSVSWRDEIYGA